MLSASFFVLGGGASRGFFPQPATYGAVQLVFGARLQPMCDAAVCECGTVLACAGYATGRARAYGITCTKSCWQSCAQPIESIYLASSSTPLQLEH